MDKKIVSKMRIKADSKVLFINTEKEVKKLILQDKTISVAKKAPADVVFVTLKSLKELGDQIASVFSKCSENGIVWIIYPKSDSKTKYDINRDSAWREVKKFRMDLVGNIAINDKWSSLRVKKV
jgi:pyruvate carboxylase